MPLDLPPDYRPVEVWEYVATGGVSVALFTSYVVGKTTPRWHGSLLYDDAVRSALLPETEKAKDRAGFVSTVTFWMLNAYPFAVDAVVTATLARGRADVAAQMVAMDAEAFALDGLLFRGLELIVRRARPFVADCIDQGGTNESCTVGNTTSMPSGHVSTVVTAASLICTHHLKLHLHESAADGVTCGAAIAVALGSTVARIMSDNHYATDATAGAAIGVLSGFVLPMSLHYGWHTPIVPMVTQQSLGVMWSSIL
jgi:membrane-associated phospholipid phosphatase